jgi:outer membrane protein insertion porin family
MGPWEESVDRIKQWFEMNLLLSRKTTPPGLCPAAQCGIVHAPRVTIGLSHSAFRSSRASRFASITSAALLCACGSIVSAQPLKSDDAKATTPAPPTATPAPAADAALQNFEDRPIREVKVAGLTKTPVQLAKNQIRSREGSPLSPKTVREDVQRVNRLGRFRQIDARVKLFDDGSVGLTFEVVETPIISAVDIIGNRQVANSEIQPLIGLLENTPVDEFQLGAARSAIEKLYRDKGYFQATVTVDQGELEKTGTVLFRVTEGERVRVTDIRFEGNVNLSSRQLMPNVKTKTAGIFESGPVDPEQLDKDVESIVGFYRDRGYLDIRADKQIIFAPNGREAIVRFIVEEGPLYTLRSVQFRVLDAEGEEADQKSKAQPSGVFTRDQIAGLMEIKAGDVYSVDKIRRSTDAVRNAYLQMGYVDAQVARAEKRDPSQPLVDVQLTVREGRAYKTGLINLKGNDITQDKVAIRELDIKPDRPLDMSRVRTGDKETTEIERKIEDTRIFAPAQTRVTVQDEDPSNPGYRDVLIEVKETNTGSLAFGVGAGSDSGVIGQISLTQRNFDVMDTPDSFGEFFSGRAFRGAGQEFNITLAPGNEVQTYSISLADPSLFDTNYQGSISGFFQKRDYDDQYNEERLGFRLGFGRKFGERWAGNISFRADNITVDDIDDDSPEDYFAVDGSNILTGIGVQLTRNTADNRFRPTKGSRLQLGIERLGAFGGDFDFTRINASHTFFLPVYESFLGYKTIFSLKNEIGYIPEGSDEVPFFERYYRGGTSFRGYRFRAISPKGIRNDTKTIGDDPVGGSWLFFAGAEIQQPVYKDIISVVGFIDSGTVTDDIGFDDYRASAGVGIRLHVPQLGPVPLAFDFGFPFLKVKGDRERVFSFSLELPF